MFKQTKLYHFWLVLIRYPFKSHISVENILLSSDYQQETFYLITAASHIVPPWR